MLTQWVVMFLNCNVPCHLQQCKCPDQDLWAPLYFPSEGAVPTTTRGWSRHHRTYVKEYRYRFILKETPLHGLNGLGLRSSRRARSRYHA